jgi:hypothetical protein
VPFLILTQTNISRSCASCQSVTVCHTEQEARHCVDRVVQTCRHLLSYESRRQRRSSGYYKDQGIQAKHQTDEWLRAVNLEAQPLAGTDTMHWLCAVMQMSERLFGNWSGGRSR